MIGQIWNIRRIQPPCHVIYAGIEYRMTGCVGELREGHGDGPQQVWEFKPRTLPFYDVPERLWVRADGQVVT